LGELEVPILNSRRAFPKTEVTFLRGVVGELKLRDIEADNLPQNTLENNLQDLRFYTLLFRSINSLLPRLHADTL
jgi:hypothetical protein